MCDLTRLTIPTLACALLLSACSGEADNDSIEVSGSATVAPITGAMAAQGRFDVNVAAEGTIDGFERFCAGETAINDASTAIPAEALATCEENGVEFVELPIGLDALTVVRHEKNDFATDLTSAELAAIFEPGSTVTTWSDVRSTWPDEEIALFGRGSGSGTFDFFTHTINGEAGAIRDDYRHTDDMAELATWIAEDENALGFMGVGNYLAADEEQRDLITNVAVDGVMPALAETQDGSYLLARPLFIYVSTAAIEEDPRVGEFVDYYVEYAPDVLPRVRFYPFAEETYGAVQERWSDRTPGAMFGGEQFVTDVEAGLEG